MDSSRFSANRVGNDFYVPAPQLSAAAPAVASAPIHSSVFTDSTPLDYEYLDAPRARKKFSKALDYIHAYSIGAFAIMFLIVGASATQVASNYYGSNIEGSIPTTSFKRSGQPLAGLNMSLPINQLEQKTNSIASQPITIQMGAHAETIPAKTILSWLQIVNNKSEGLSYVHVNDKAILASLKSVVDSNSKPARNQITVTHGGVSTTVIGGIDGIKVGDHSVVAKNIAMHLLAGKGIQENIPTQTIPFSATTPAAFVKMVEINLSTKQMYLYENGSILKTYPVSAGASDTPTPVGQFKTMSKRTVQDMKGFNPNGTKYFQPNVKWISYFADGGFAIHGNYWRPTSYFGNINSSHGCVSLPDSQAKEVFDWTPIGTTVIIH